MNAAELNRLRGQLIIEEMVRCGVSCFCLSPGSRSTPLALALADRKDIELVTHFDERGAAFFALGHARATGKPAVVVCTSGTAAANYFPAIIDAANDRVPLVAITADRPPELRDCGANQTINQINLFGHHARWFCDLDCPTKETDPSHVLGIVDQAVARSISPVAGPVQLNCMFREPLAADDLKAQPWPEELKQWANSSRPVEALKLIDDNSSEGKLNRVIEAIRSSQRGMIVAGSLKTETAAKAVLGLARKLNWPLLPDIRSGIRMVDDELVIGSYDLCLLSEQVRAKLKPDVVIQFGERLVSKRLLEFIGSCPDAQYMILTDAIDRVDPTHTVHLQVTGNVESLCRKLFDKANEHQSGMLELWKKADSETTAKIREFVTQSDEPTEISLACTLTESLPEQFGLFSASSLPIRALNSFAARSGRITMVGSNRGASGIDGTIASACGYGSGLGQPVIALLGDLAALHDLNSLALLKKTNHPVILIVINNDGGAIFEHLPIGMHQETCTEFFVMPHGMKFDKAAATFGVEYIKIDRLKQLKKVMADAVRKEHSILVEVTVDREISIQHYRTLEDQICNHLNEMLG